MKRLQPPGDGSSSNNATTTGSSSGSSTGSSSPGSSILNRVFAGGQQRFRFDNRHKDRLVFLFDMMYEISHGGLCWLVGRIVGLAGPDLVEIFVCRLSVLAALCAGGLIAIFATHGHPLPHTATHSPSPAPQPRHPTPPPNPQPSRTSTGWARWCSRTPLTCTSSPTSSHDCGRRSS